MAIINTLFKLYCNGELIQYLKDNIENPTENIINLLKHPINISSWTREGKPMEIIITNDDNHKLVISGNDIYFYRPYLREAILVKLKI